MEPSEVRVIVPPSDDPVDAAEARRAREALGLTLSEFARVMGVDTDTAARWESGRHPPQNPRLWRWAVLAVAEGDAAPAV